jgi:hypothetical protein
MVGRLTRGVGVHKVVKPWELKNVPPGSQSPRAGGQRVVYGRADRPSVLVPVAGHWVECQVLHKTIDSNGTWWARVGYLHPTTYDYAQEDLPASGLH